MEFTGGGERAHYFGYPFPRIPGGRVKARTSVVWVSVSELHTLSERRWPSVAAELKHERGETGGEMGVEKLAQPPTQTLFRAAAGVVLAFAVKKNAQR